MKMREFTLVLQQEPSDDEADKMYGVIRDGSIAGVPMVYVHREAATLEEAIRSAIGDVRSVGFDVQRVEMEPGAVALPT